jgi:ribosomal-protein-alanine N-acetyltransferase
MSEMTDVKIVAMGESHVREVVAIEQAVFGTPWTEDMFRQEIEGAFGSQAFVATLNARVVGYSIAWFFEKEVHLVNIAVHSAYRKRGVGNHLLNHLIHRALERGMRIVTLEVRASNHSAQTFYRRAHFRPIGIRKRYYSDNREDAVLMVLDLERLRGGRPPKR